MEMRWRTPAGAAAEPIRCSSAAAVAAAMMNTRTAGPLMAEHAAQSQEAGLLHCDHQRHDTQREEYEDRHEAVDRVVGRWP